MNQRQYVRNIGRIPRLLFHIKRCKAKGQPERVAGFQAELKRRKLEMQLAEHDDLLKDLLKIKLEHFANDDSVKLAAMIETASVGMPGAIAELTPADKTVN